MRKWLAVVFLFSFAACTNSSDAPVEDSVAVKKDSLPLQPVKEALPAYIHKFTDTALERKVTALLLKLPFVKKSDTYIDSVSGHKHGISFMLDNTKGDSSISVLAGYNSEERFETYYHFYVDPKTMDVTIYDPLTNKTLTVKEYLKRSK